MRNSIIDMMRAIAAFAVVTHHVHARVPSSQGIFELIGEYGYYGVDVFFIISGWVVSSTVLRYSDSVAFVTKRYLRVLVPFFPLGLIYFYSKSSEFNAVSSLCLIPAFSKPALSIGWTLQFEVLFYVILSFVIFYRKYGLKLFMIIVFIVSYFFDVKNQGHFLWMITSDYMLEFLAGVLIYMVYDKSIITKAIAVLITVLLLGYFGDFERQLVALILFLLVYIFLFLLNMRFDLAVLSSLGLISYSTYLIHLPIISYLHHSFDFSFLQMMSVGLPLIYMTSWCYYQLFEKRMTRLVLRYVV